VKKFSSSGFYIWVYKYIKMRKCNYLRSKRQNLVFCWPCEQEVSLTQISPQRRWKDEITEEDRSDLWPLQSGRWMFVINWLKYFYCILKSEYFLHLWIWEREPGIIRDLSDDKKPPWIGRTGPLREPEFTRMKRLFRPFLFSTDH